MSTRELIKKSEAHYPMYKSGSHGSEDFYRISSLTGSKLIMTSGVKELFENESCYWLGDIVVSYFPRILSIAREKDESFMVVRISKNLTTEGALFTIDDGNETDDIYITQRIPYTDIKMNVKLYLQTDGERWTLMCPSEY